MSFHPLVAFADHDQALADLTGATIALDGDESLLPLLADLAESIGARPVTLPEGGKTAYHAAAMMAAGGLVGLLDAIASGRPRWPGSTNARRSISMRRSPARRWPTPSGSVSTVRSPDHFSAATSALVREHLATLRANAPDAVALYVEVARRELAIALRRGELSEDQAAEISRLLDEAAP